MSTSTAVPIFSQQFLDVQPQDIVKSIHETGYFSFPQALTPAFLEQLQRELSPHRPGLNVNDASPVWFNEQYFFPHALACSRSYFNYVTAEPLRLICQEKFEHPFRLKCHRYYETGPGHSMDWHADNVTNDGLVTDSNGLIFILYVNDVFDGEFQLVSGSYKERKSGTWSYNYTNEFIETTFGEKVTSFRMPAGSLIVYDTYGIHRAKPIVSRTFVRKSIFFQVDESDQFAEKLLLNPSYFDSRDDRLLDYLGFGKSHDFAANPPSNVKDVPLPRLAGFQRQLISAFFYRIRYGFFHLLPHDTRIKYNRWKAGFVERLRKRHPAVFRVLKAALGRGA